MKRASTLFMILSLIFNVTYAQELNVIEARYFDKPIIQMTINDKKAWVLLDTGSGVTILNSRVKDEFGFMIIDNSSNELNVPGFGSTENRLRRAAKARIKFGGVSLRGIIYAFDFSSITKSIQKRTGKKISAIIGTKMMRKYGFVLDMSKGSAYMPDHNQNNRKQNNKAMNMLVLENL